MLNTFAVTGKTLSHDWEKSEGDGGERLYAFPELEQLFQREA